MIELLLIYTLSLKKNKIIEGSGGGGGFGHGGGFGLGGGRGFGYRGRGWGYRGWGYGGGYGRRGWGYGGGYNTLYYQPPNNLCYDSLGNLTYCLIPSYFY